VVMSCVRPQECFQHHRMHFPLYEMVAAIDH
jgi:hypothetical protein